jgi:hypothetical protein
MMVPKDGSGVAAADAASDTDDDDDRRKAGASPKKADSTASHEAELILDWRPGLFHEVVQKDPTGNYYDDDNMMRNENMIGDGE